jgi:hypothetical protein
MGVTWSSALSWHWRREVLRTNLWVVPGLEVLGGAALFGCTLVLVSIGPGPHRELRLP